MPKVSVIVPNFNHAKYLAQRLDSIFSQTYQDFEVILLDDCSTDDSRQVLERYRHHPKVSRVIYNETNSGSPYKQWYNGISYAKGDLAWIAESDDWCDERFLEALVPHFKDQEVALAFADSLYVYRDSLNPDREGEIARSEKHEGLKFIRDEMLGGNGIINASMTLFRRERYLAVKDLGFMDMKLCGDWIIWVQMIEGSRVVHVPYRLNYLRRHEQNATNKFRAAGLDFIEGLRVMREAKRICGGKYDRDLVLSRWLDRYLSYKTEFSRGVTSRVNLAMLTMEPRMFFYINWKIFKWKAKALLRKLRMLKEPIGYA